MQNVSAPQGHSVAQPVAQPVAHQVVMSFLSADDASAAVLLLLQRGFDAAGLSCYTPSQMRQSGPLTRLGLPLHVLSTQRELGRRGHSIVAARATSERLVDTASTVARETHAHALQCWDGYRLQNLLAPEPTPRRRPLTRRPATASSAPQYRWQTGEHPSTAP